MHSVKLGEKALWAEQDHGPEVNNISSITELLVSVLTDDPNNCESQMEGQELALVRLAFGFVFSLMVSQLGQILPSLCTPSIV